MTRIAIIGAGLSGLTAAHRLKDHADVTLFEKSRGVGGRMSTRRAEPYAFDHGAQFFKARTVEFQRFIQPMVDAGVIQPWLARVVEFDQHRIGSRRTWDLHNPHYVGAPGMSAVGKYLSQELNVKTGVRVESLTRDRGHWRLLGEAGQLLGDYDWVISAAPAQQAAELIAGEHPIASRLNDIKMQPCVALMLGFEKPLPLDFDAAQVRNGDISWIAVNSSKPQRGSACSLLVHSSNQWADEHMDQAPDYLRRYLRQQASEIIGCDLGAANHQAVHSWRFAIVPPQSGDTHFLDPAQNLAVCGDWFIQGRVESAFTSALAMSNSLLTQLQ